MDKILHKGWAKWLAGLVMMTVFGIGIYFGVRVVVAVETGGLEILNGDVSSSYEQSRRCAGDLAEEMKEALYNELQVQLYKQDFKNIKHTAMTVTDYTQWIGAQTSNQNAGAPAAEAVPAEDEVVTQGIATAEGVPETEAYTYEYLLSLRNTNKVTENDSVGTEFFDDADTGEKKPSQYIKVSRDELEKMVIAHATQKYILNSKGDVVENEDEWTDDDGYSIEKQITEYAADEDEWSDDGASDNGLSDVGERLGTDKLLYQYEATIGEDSWSYNEVTRRLDCSRFGMVKQNVPVYYHQSDLDKYADGLLVEGQQDAGAALLVAPMCYIDGLIEYYTRNLVLYKEQMEMLKYISDDYVNYRYRIELQDGTVWTNTGETGDITEQASVYWSYDDGEMSGTMTKENQKYFYEELAGYSVRVVNYDGDYLNVGIYLRENIKRADVVLAQAMMHRDDMKNSKEAYEDYLYLHQNARTYLYYTIIMGLIGLVLFVYLLLVVGYQDRKGTLAKASLSFRIPTEIVLLFVFVLCTIFYAVAEEGPYFLIHEAGGELNFMAAIAIGFLWSVLPASFEMLSRIRHRELLARSICFRVFRFVVQGPVRWLEGRLDSMRNSMADVMQAIRLDARLSGIFLASQVGLCLLLMLSFGFFAGGVGGMGLIFLFLAFALELLICLAVFRDIRYTVEIIRGVSELKNGNLDYQIPTEHMQGHKKELAESINHLQNGLKVAVEQSIKDERLKTELITNVSHDIKTPLTSIINYVDLLKKEPAADETVQHYLEVLDQKSQRLKQLMEDLVEVSKSATGNVEFTPMRLDLIEMLRQILGEFEDKFASRNLEIIENFKLPAAVAWLDSRHTYRVFENLCQNIYKYAMEHSRVYVDVLREDDKVCVVMKNISQYALNISADELMERFVRGDESRNTSGSGLGLSITKNLVTLQQGEFEIALDGDLFKTIVIFPLSENGFGENMSAQKETPENDKTENEMA